jgi:hypothetical protein
MKYWHKRHVIHVAEQIMRRGSEWYNVLDFSALVTHTHTIYFITFVFEFRCDYRNQTTVDSFVTLNVITQRKVWF